MTDRHLGISTTLYGVARKGKPSQSKTICDVGPPDTNGFLLLTEAPGRPTKAAAVVAIFCTSSAESVS